MLSEWGYWGEELVGPLYHLDKAGYETIFCTPSGRRPVPIPVSLDPSYIDPPLGRPVTTEENARRARELDQVNRLDNPKNLSTWFPERPYWSAPNLLRELERYYAMREEAWRSLEEFDALLMVGGSGPIVDMVNNQRVHDVILGFYRADKPIAAECYAVTCLVMARELEDRRSIIWGKHVTGHPIEYDYHDGTGFVGTDFNMGPPPYTLEYMLRDAVGPQGQFIGNVGKRTSAIVDYPFITSRSTASSYLCGELLVHVLEKGLKRYGW
jgi:putative intracellular protease/amidase